MRAARESSPADLPVLMDRFQAAAAKNVAAHAGLILEEQGIDPEPVAEFDPMGLVGWASDGRPAASLVTLPSFTEAQFEAMVRTQLADIQRQAAAVEAAVRPQVKTYVRALVLPSCGRCIVLAGKVYRREQAFDRHPRCDCQNIPSDRRNASKLTVDPRAAFRQMSPEDRVKSFTRAGAEAIDAGADIGQVVNARRGMESTVAENGRARIARNKDGVFVTAEGAWESKRGRVRGVAAKRMREYGVNGPRLMPESIMELASTRDEAIRLLTRYGYIRT